MGRKFGVLSCVLLNLVLLGGCQGPAEGGAVSVGVSPPQTQQAQEEQRTPQSVLEQQRKDEDHDAFLVETGGSAGTVLVTVERERADQPGGEDCLILQVWDREDMKTPRQTMAVEGSSLPYSGDLHWSLVEDANFDGYMDFGYAYAVGNQPIYYKLWLWEEGAGQFVGLPAFDEISAPVFEKETQTITGWARSSGAGTGVNTFHRWADGQLICVRRVEAEFDPDSDCIVLSVTDWAGGKQTEVFRREYPQIVGDAQLWAEEEQLRSAEAWIGEREKWLDLNYHGET